MKICHITSVHDHDDIRIFQKECVSLAKNDEFQVYLVAEGDSIEVEGVSIIGLGERPRKRLERFLNFADQAYNKAIHIDADLYHFHDPELLRFAKKLKKRGKIVIYDSHEIITEQIKIKSYIPKFLRGFISRVFEAYETRTCRYIDAIIFPCPIDGKHPFEGKANKYIYINNLPIINEQALQIKRSFLPRAICCVGSLTEARGIENLVKACYISNTKLILAGDISPSSFKEHLNNMKEFDNVEYRGFCNKEQVAEIYKSSGLLVSNIISVGQYGNPGNLPTKVYESMMFAIPVILSDVKYNRDFIDKYECGLIANENDPFDIAEKINYIFDNQEKALLMGENGRNAVLEYFNWSIEEKKLVDLYMSFKSD